MRYKVTICPTAKVLDDLIKIYDMPKDWNESMTIFWQLLCQKLIMDGHIKIERVEDDLTKLKWLKDRMKAIYKRTALSNIEIEDLYEYIDLLEKELEKTKNATNSDSVRSKGVSDSGD